MITRLAHVCLKTAQYDTLVRFYRDTLGLKMKFTFTNRDGALFGCYFELGGQTFLELFDQAGANRQWGGEDAPLQPNHNTFYQHFCLEVEGIESLRAELVAKGVDVTAVAIGMDGSKQAWIRDPDGNSIELMEYTAASQQLQPGYGGNAR